MSKDITEITEIVQQLISLHSIPRIAWCNRCEMWTYVLWRGVHKDGIRYALCSHCRENYSLCLHPQHGVLLIQQRRRCSWWRRLFWRNPWK